jgi:hypothetical protein
MRVSVAVLMLLASLGLVVCCFADRAVDWVTAAPPL